MPIKDVLQEMEVTLRRLKGSTYEERVVIHKDILSILSQVDAFELEHPAPNYKIYRQDLLTSLTLLCGGEVTEMQKGECLGRSLLAMRQMASYTCFNVNNHYI